MAEKRITAPEIQAMKARGEKIAMLTASDYPTGRLIDDAGIDIALVGDSLGMVVLGLESTLPVTMDIMIHHTQAVARGCKKALIVADMPFMSYQASPEQAILNAGRFIQEAGAGAIKLEGGSRIGDIIERITAAGIPVMGHLGMTPQSVHQFGGYRKQGGDETAAAEILDAAKTLQQAGAFSIVLEHIPHALAGQITEALEIPTIGIGAGPNCDGQVLVSHDVLGFYDKFVPPFAKQYAHIWDTAKSAFSQYCEEVKAGEFPQKISKK